MATVSVLSESFLIEGIFAACFWVSFEGRTPAFALSIRDWRKLSFCAKTLLKTKAKNIVNKNFNANVDTKILVHSLSLFFHQHFLYTN